MGVGVESVLLSREESVKYVLFVGRGWGGVEMPSKGVGCVPDDRPESEGDETRNVVGTNG